MKPVKWKKMNEKNQEKRKIISGNIGIISSSILFLSAIQEILGFFCGEHSKGIAMFMGIAALVICVICMKVNVSEKISNKKNLNGVMEVCTFVSIVNFIIANIMLNSPDKRDVYGGLALIAYDVTITMIYAFWTFRFRKDRHWNVD